MRIDTQRAGWQQGNTAGQKLLPLHQFNGEITQLIWLEAGQLWRPVIPQGGLEMFIIEGSLELDQHTLSAQTWLRRPGLTRCEFTVREGPVRVLLKTGHLPTESV
ncbi:cupin domain-containing protein [Salinimonas marina]|uniref:cupin domain-containing protein n=1 Tax=Salinimonas marina TaxID=2785918 RepID=UPI001E48586C|nr:cupin domain-containing protein [Salinimonas marina]